MKLLGKQLLHDFKEAHADARTRLESWESEVEDAEWKNPRDLKQRYPRASIIGNNVIFDLCWNRYRLWALIAYKTATILIKRIGTHKEYDKWNIS